MTKSHTQGSDFDEHDDSKNGEFKNIDVSPEFLSLLEATVLAAGKYVVPSDDLRPHTLEAAREIDSDREQSSKLVKYAVVFAICGCLGLSLADRLSPWREKFSGKTSLQIQERALLKNMGPDWGLLEVFQERQKQASQSRTPPQLIEEKIIEE